MRKIYLMLFGVVAMSKMGAQQIELKVVNGMGSLLYDINDYGKAIHSGSYYDFATGVSSPSENGEGTEKINNAGDVAGYMSYLVGEDDDIGQAAYKKNGVWNAIGYFPGTTPGNSWFGYAHAISENSKYVTGQITESLENSYAYIYNTETKDFKKLNGDGSFEYGRGEGINDSGIVAGFVNRYSINNSTYWIPVYYTPDGVVHYIGDLGKGEATDINNAGQVVGYKNNRPFIFDINTNAYKEFNIPAGYSSATFTSISANGIAVGYAGSAGEREAIVYHPSIGAHPILLKDFLSRKNINVSTFDGKLGAVMGISQSGNYICGFDNIVPPMFASGWALNLDNQLLTTNDCKINCPDNIGVELTSPTETSATVNYTLPIVCGATSSTGLKSVLVSGFESGSKFPLGVTYVVHNLEDANGNVVYVCSFEVEVKDYYCSSISQVAVDPISRVEFAGIDNVSDPYSNVASEYFLDEVGDVAQGEQYPITIEGNTYEEYDYVSVFVDWNHNGSFDDEGEMYKVGGFVSNGEDGGQLTGTIAVPANAALGMTRMRVILKWEDFMETPCDNSTYFYGQSEDYMLNVKESLAVEDLGKKAMTYYPNPVKDILNLVSEKDVTNVSVYNIDGKLVRNITGLSQSKVQLDLSTLVTGTYVVKATTKDSIVKTFKVVKK